MRIFGLSHELFRMETQEFVTQMKTVFDLCDPKGLGYITVNSFLDLGHNYLGTHGKDIENLLLLLDPGGKGFLDFEDFCRGILACMTDECQLTPLDHATMYLENMDHSFQGHPDRIQLEIGGSSSDDHMTEDLLCTCSSDFEMTSDDLPTRDSHCAFHNGGHRRHNDDDDASRQSPESFGDADSAIVVVPPTSESCSGSPDFTRKIISLSDGEEKFECYGEGEDCDISASSTPTTATKCQHNNNNNNNNNNRNGKGAQTFQKRTTWLRTSLRRSPSERRRVSSNSLASHLYRSSSFNSSRNSSSGESDDMHQDLSLEDDVLDLNQKVQMLQQQVSALANNQNTTDDKYGRVKQENAALTAKVHMLEEQLRELEVRSEDRIREEQQRFKDLVARHERERSLDLETYTLKLQSSEKENAELREEVFRQRALAERLKQEKSAVQDQLSESEYAFSVYREEQRKMQDLGKRERDGLVQERVGNARVLEEITKELQDLRRFRIDSEYQYRMNGHGGMEPPSRLRDLEEQIRVLKEENREVREANEELQAQLLNSSIAEGRSLLHCGEGTSLAAEFEAMSKDEVMEALRDQREVNSKLRAYIDGILLNIMESYPALLEVKGKHHPPPQCLKPTK